MSLTPQTRRQLIAKAHDLNPVVIIGNRGLVPSVMAEIDRALTDHELIKIKVNTDTREDREAMMKLLSSDLKADCLRIIGHVAIVYRVSDKKL
jgi:RNA-binding protein